MYCYKKYFVNPILADEVGTSFGSATTSTCLPFNKVHLLPLVLGEVEDDDVRAVSPLREGEQPPVLVDGERGQVLPPAGGQCKKRSKPMNCLPSFLNFAT